MRDLAPYIMIGITTGSIYALAAVGLVLTFKTSGIFNFAHGAQAAVAAYVFYEFYERMGVAWPLAGGLTLVIVGLAGGLILERLAAGLAGAPLTARVAATIGLLIGTQGLLEKIFGGQALIVQFFLPTRPIDLPGFVIREDQIIVTFLALAATLGLYWFLKTRRLGIAMQAAIEDPDLLAAKGINPLRVRRWAWIIGSTFATVSGILLAPITSLNASVLTLLVFYAFGAAALGMFDSLVLTHLGGLAIGIGAAVLTKYITGGGALAGLPSSLPFIVLFGALVFAPKGKLRVRESGPLRRPLPARTATRRISPLYAAALVLGVLVVIPHVVGSARVSLYASALGFSVIFVSLALLVRVSGQISLCQMTFAGIGAAAFGHAMGAGWPWALALLAAGFAALPAGIAVALPAFRLSGLYLAMATFSFALLVRDVLFFTPWMFGERRDSVLYAPRPHFGGLHLDTDVGYYYVVLVIAVAAVFLAYAVIRGRLGRLLRAMADAPAAVNAHGTNTNVSKFLVFCVSAFLAGIGGAILTPISGSINVLSYHPIVSLVLVAVLFIAGSHPIRAAAIAAALHVLLPGYITSSEIQPYLPISFGVLAIVCSVLVGRSLLRRTGDRIAESTRARERVAHHPAEARLPHLELAEAQA
jgi:ABC-type branched-subunit amino acid transport system permease subunit